MTFAKSGMKLCTPSIAVASQKALKSFFAASDMTLATERKSSAIDADMVEASTTILPSLPVSAAAAAVEATIAIAATAALPVCFILFMFLSFFVREAHFAFVLDTPHE